MFVLTGTVAKSRFVIPRIDPSKNKKSAEPTKYKFQRLNFQSKTLDSLDTYPLLESKELQSNYQSALNKVANFGTDVKCYCDILSTCIYLEEKESVERLEGTEQPTVRVRVAGNSIKFNATGDEIVKAYNDHLIHNVLVWSYGIGKAFEGKVTYFNPNTGSMWVTLPSAPELFRGHHENRTYRVVFVINRVPFRTQHNAVHLFGTGRIFNSLINNERYFSLEAFTMSTTTYEDNPSLNSEQNMAIRCIKSSDLSVPYLIFGPPGSFI